LFTSGTICPFCLSCIWYDILINNPYKPQGTSLFCNMFWPFRSCWDKNMTIIGYNYSKQKHNTSIFLFQFLCDVFFLCNIFFFLLCILRCVYFRQPKKEKDARAISKDPKEGRVINSLCFRALATVKIPFQD